MNAQFYSYLSIGAFVVAAIFFVVAVILFFAFDIPSIWGELSGKTAAKQVAEIRAANRNVTTRRRASVTTSDSSNSKVKQIGRLQGSQPANRQLDVDLPETELLENDTELLQDQTALLEPETTILGGETTLLSPETPLLEGKNTNSSMDKQINENFTIVQSVLVIHTNEKI